MEDPIRQIVEELNSLLRWAEQHASQPMRGQLPSGAEAQLTLLEKMVKKMAEEQDKRLMNFTFDPKKLTKEQVSLLDRCTEVAVRAMVLDQGLRGAVNKVAGKTTPAKKKREGSSTQKRKSKFKQMGGERWKRL